MDRIWTSHSWLFNSNSRFKLSLEMILKTTTIIMLKKGINRIVVAIWSGANVMTPWRYNSVKSICYSNVINFVVHSCFCTTLLITTHHQEIRLAIFQYNIHKIWYQGLYFILKKYFEIMAQNTILFRLFIIWIFIDHTQNAINLENVENIKMSRANSEQSYFFIIKFAIKPCCGFNYFYTFSTMIFAISKVMDY